MSLHYLEFYVGEGNGAPLQYSCLENPMGRGAWWAAVHGVARSRTWLRDFTFTFHFDVLEKEMTTHSIVLAWRIPGLGEPGGLPSMGSHRVGYDWSDLVAAAAEFYVMQLYVIYSLKLTWLNSKEGAFWKFKTSLVETKEQNKCSCYLCINSLLAKPTLILQNIIQV